LLDSLLQEKLLKHGDCLGLFHDHGHDGGSSGSSQAVSQHGHKK